MIMTVSDIIILSPYTDNDPLYLGFMLNSPAVVRQKAQKGQGDAVVHITSKALSDITVLLPPLPEQRAIAAILSDADGYIAALERLIAKKRDIKQGAMQELLTGRLKMPECCGEWIEKPLKKVCEFINGRAYSQNELLNRGKYRVLRLGNLFTNENWYYSDLELPEKMYCENNDLLYAWSASFGPTIWHGEKVIFHYHIWKINCFDEINKGFLYHYLSFDTQRIMNELQGGTMFHLTKDSIENRFCKFPKSISEQYAIAEILSNMDAEIDALTSKLNKVKLIKQGMMQQLLTGKIRLEVREDA